jgi:hypothetical protein
MSRLITGILMAILCGPVPAEDPVGDPGRTLRELAVEWLKENTAFISCDDQHFVYGVGYIDGSYMERIFYVRGGGDRPAITVKFREPEQRDLADDGVSGPLPFVLEMASPEVLSAIPSAKGWQVSDEAWESALRFKYTSWYGDIIWQDGEWTVDWQGYRRPMLPASVIEHADEICAMFSGR